MSDGIMFSIGDDGVVREYKPDYDITIHCENCSPIGKRRTNEKV